MRNGDLQKQPTTNIYRINLDDNTRTARTLYPPPTPLPRPENTLRTKKKEEEEEKERRDTPISLTSPRPTPQRIQNLYVDAPPRNDVISSQPRGASVINNGLSKKKKGLSELPNREEEEEEESIICRECGRCRCQACRTPKRLPRKWLCSDKCLCSAETVVDAVSCYCCVRGAFYHCQKDRSPDEGTDKPCSCSGEGACARWSCLTALSLVMPCLWCYLPLGGCVKLSEYLYGKCSMNGCECEEDKSTSNNNNNVDKSILSTDSEKRLLG